MIFQQVKMIRIKSNINLILRLPALGFPSLSLLSSCLIYEPLLCIFAALSRSTVSADPTVVDADSPTAAAAAVADNLI